jgi:hypothetical protein
MLRFISIVLFSIVAWSNTASAERWNHTITKDDFGDAHVGIALALKSGRGFGVRCTNKEVPVILFATRETWGDQLALIPATLLLKIDDGEVEKLTATLESYPMRVGFEQKQGVRASAAGDWTLPIIERLAKARRRIAVAIEIAGQRFKNTRFSASGSTSAISKIWDYCGSRFADKPSG